MSEKWDCASEYPGACWTYLDAWWLLLRFDLPELLFFTLPLGCSCHVRGTCAFLAVLGPVLRDSDTSTGMSCSASCVEVQWLKPALGLH